MFRDPTILRLRQRVKTLHGDFRQSLTTFAQADLFSGPSVYFHTRTIESLRKHRSAADALRDDSYLELLYATLTAWGLHRMGPGNAKLLELEDIRRNLLECADLVRELESYRISDFGTLTVDEVTHMVTNLVASVRVSRARTFLVSSTKALHHLLPSLVPPVDREYTLSFFFHSCNPDGIRDEEVFRTIFPYFHELGVKKRAVRSVLDSLTVRIPERAVRDLHQITTNRCLDHCCERI